MRRGAAATFCALGLLAGAIAAGPARADGPGVGAPAAVVAVGDSAISGEAGR